MDTNKHVINGALCKQLGGEDLQMRDVVHSESKGPGPRNWFQGKDLIGGIWVSLDVDIIGAGYLPFNGTLGGHQPLIADLTMSSAIGKQLKNIAPPHRHGG